jgi:hypothetical protein
MKNWNVVGVSLLSLLVLSSACGLCGIRTESEARSPDGAWKSILYSRDCGTLGSYTTEISVMPSSQKQRGTSWGNVSSIDDYEGHLLLPLTDSRVIQGVRLEWRGPRSLAIFYPHQARLLQKLSSVEGITISYQPF